MLFDEMQCALIKNDFKRMYADIGHQESLRVLQELLETASLLTEVLIDEQKREKEDGTGD